MSEPYHIPVMASEVLELLDVVKGGFYIDCTLGGGGHTLAILEKGGRVIGIDRDPGAVEFARNRLAGYTGSFNAQNAVFSQIESVAGGKGVADGVLMDLGVSSRMLDDHSRGFSFSGDGPLLMTMGLNGETAYDLINSSGADELGRIFRVYGEERHYRKIAALIVQARKKHPINSTGELSVIIEQAVGGRMPQKSKARIFQALRIYLNDEIGELKRGLAGALNVLKAGGRICVISYHSLEDREVKTFFRDKAFPCICPPDFPVCTCGLKPELKILTNKGIKASEEEMRLNTRARSAIMRCAEKLAEN